MKTIGRILRIAYTVGVLAAFAASFPLFSHAWAQDSARDFIREIKLFDTVAHYVRMSYVTEVDATELIHDAIRGMLSGLDEHTAFLEADDFRLLLNDTEGSFGGLGIEISVTPEDDTLTVMNVLEGTPAERAGLRARDKIIEIEGESTKGITTREALLKMRGEPGTDLAIGIARVGFADQLDFTITREIIHIDSVPYYFMASDDVGYVRISNFSRDEERSTSKDATKALEELREQGMKKFILDLRGNPGGPLDEAVALASLFLKKKELVVYTGGRSERWEERKYFVKDKPEFGGEPFVILIDGSSASASEVFTGAIKDHKRAVVMGEKSFGKASVQTLIPLASSADADPGPGLKITIAYYYTPDGQLIDGEGIAPDVELEPEEVSLILGKLFAEGYFRIYAEQYHDAHGASALSDFEADPAAFDEFVAWVEERDLDFYPEGYAETLPDDGRQFYLGAMRREEEQLTRMLRRELIREMEGDAAAYRYWRQDDPWIARAVEELS
ncbi:MAG: S41 family peptidase [Candidatus Coatesbacteria bacterium]|nr:MAG: S41 family peptidase [Candidatus Coatesbacteria bacterium]